MKKRKVEVVTEDDRFKFKDEVELAISGYPDNAKFDIKYSHHHHGIYSALIFIEFVEDEV